MRIKFESAIALTPSKGVFYADIDKNSTVMDKKLLDILCCPISKIGLQRLSAQQLAQLNGAISAGAVTQADGLKIATPLKEALITQDMKRIYRLDDGIPVMLADEAIDARYLDASFPS